jgi:hypothetical protein
VPISGSEKTIALKDIVEVVRGYADPAQRLVFYNGRPAIVLSVSILDGVNAVEFGHRLKHALGSSFADALGMPFVSSIKSARSRANSSGVCPGDCDPGGFCSLPWTAPLGVDRIRLRI